MPTVTSGTLFARGSAATMPLMRSERWLTVAGFGTWLVSALPTLFAIIDGRLGGASAIVWACAFVAFGLAFGVICLRHQAQPVRTGLLML